MSNTLVSSMLMMVKTMTFLTEDNEELTKITMELLVMVTVIAMEQQTLVLSVLSMLAVLHPHVPILRLALLVNTMLVAYLLLRT